jgi:hypothetical protein
MISGADFSWQLAVSLFKEKPYTELQCDANYLTSIPLIFRKWGGYSDCHLAQQLGCQNKHLTEIYLDKSIIFCGAQGQMEGSY